ncbi:MAG: vWA domain-containing protein [Halanaerobiales bacterium]
MNFLYLSYSYLYLTAGFIVLFYFLKGIKKQNRVSSLLFWKDLYKEKSTFSFKLKFSPDLLFFLQLLILLLIVTALLQPVSIREVALDSRIILILDQSASMQAEDLVRDRFSIAIDKAVNRIISLSDDAEIALIAAGKNPELLHDFTREHDRVINTLERLQAQDIEINLSPALDMAEALYQEDNQAKIELYSDGSFHQESVISRITDNSANLELIQIGSSIGNIGITGFDIRNKSSRPGEYEIFLKVANLTEERVIVPISIRSSNTYLDIDSAGQIIDDTISMDPGETRDLSYALEFNQLSFLQISLEIEDSYSLDNSCLAVVGKELETDYNVMLISEGNYFLERSLEVIPGINLTVQRPPGNRRDGMDLVIFDNYLPTNTDYNGNSLYIGVKPPWVNERLERIEGSSNVTYWDRTSSIFRFVNFQGLQIRDYLTINREITGESNNLSGDLSGVDTLISTPEGPVMLALKEAEKRSIFMGINIQQSNMPLQPGFPLFISNLISWYNPVEFNTGLNHISTGDSYYYTPDNVKRPISVIDPAGKEVPIVRGEDSYLVNNTTAKGIYRLINNNEEEDYFAVNLLSMNESDFRRVYSTSAGEKVSGKGLRTFPLWPYIITLVLILLLIEWVYYYKPEILNSNPGVHTDEYTS